MMEAASPSKTLVNSYQTTWCNTPEDSHLQVFSQPQYFLTKKVQEYTPEAGYITRLNQQLIKYL
jgi:hypothetical protein